MSDFDAKIFNAISGGTIQAVIPNAGKGKASDAEFAKMTPAQRLDYCRQFPQPLDGGRRA